jgi:hypothetical protein
MRRKQNGRARPSPSAKPRARYHSRDAGRLGDPGTPAAHAFLVRLWKETRETSGRAPIWRGTVSNLRGHHLGSFSSVAKLLEILSDTSGLLVLLRRDDRGAGADADDRGGA